MLGIIGQPIGTLPWEDFSPPANQDAGGGSSSADLDQDHPGAVGGPIGTGANSLTAEGPSFAAFAEAIGPASAPTVPHDLNGGVQHGD
jgi:hypothetical protein